MAFDAGTIEATLDIDRAPFREGLIAARKEAEAFEKRGIKLKIDVDKNFAGKIQRAINDVQGSTGRGIKIPVDIDESQLDDFKRKLDRIGDNTETTASRTGNRMARALLNPMVLQLGLIPGIAAAAGTAGALALSVLPVAIGAVGVAALKNNEVIKGAFADTWQEIKSGAEDVAEPLEGVFVQEAHRLSAAWQTVRPDVAQMFKDSAPLIYQFTDGVLRAAEQAVPRFRTALAVSGPAVRGFSNLIEDLGIGVGDMAVEMSKGSVDMGRSADLVGDLLRGLLRDVGTLVTQFSRFWASIGPQFNQTFDMLMNRVLEFTQGGLRGLGQGLEITLSVVQAFLSVLGPFAQIIGQVSGDLLSVASTWRIVAGAIGLAAKAWNLLKPSEWVSKMSGVTSVVQNAAQSFGGLVTKVSGSEEAGERFTRVTTKIWSGVTKAASSLPILGTAFLAGKAIIDSFYPSADELAKKIQEGGAAAAEARTQMYSVADGYNRGSLTAQAFAATSEEVRDAIKKQREGMTDLERAQADAAAAQRNYDYAVDKFGENSSQAKSAQLDLADATGRVERAQDRAAKATQTHTDKIIEQTNLMLGAVGARLNYQSSLLQLEQAQRALADAVKEHGVGSLEARQADIAYQQQLLTTVNAIGQRVTAENQAKGKTEAARLATAAMHQEIARLAVEAGENLPPALAEMASGLSDSELAAMGVTREVDNTGQAIYRLPPGKTLSFPNNAPVAQSQVENLARAIDNVKPSKWITFYLKTVTTGNPAPDPNFGNVPGLLGSAAPRAKGGPVKAGRAYWTGEAGLPELFFPDTDGFILNGRDSAKIANAVRNPDTSQNSVPLGSDGPSAPDFDSLIRAVSQALFDAMHGARLQVDGDGVARLVNQSNLRNGVR